MKRVMAVPLDCGRRLAGLSQWSKDLILRQASGSRGTRADQGGLPHKFRAKRA
jgi:hypothetical protein